MQVLIVQIFGAALTVLMAKWCGESLYLNNGTMRERWTVFLFSGVTVFLFPFWTVILLMYLLTQAFSDLKDGTVDVLLNLQAGAVMAAYAMVLLPAVSGVLWIALVALLLLFTQRTFGSGDTKGILVSALWGLIYLNRGNGIFASGSVLSMPAVYGFLITLLSVCIYGKIKKMNYDIPLFPWLFFGYGAVSGCLKIVAKL